MRVPTFQRNGITDASFLMNVTDSSSYRIKGVYFFLPWRIVTDTDSSVPERKKDCYRNNSNPLLACLGGFEPLTFRFGAVAISFCKKSRNTY